MPIFGCPGIRAFAEVGTGPIRGFHITRDVPYVVSGRGFFRLNQDGTSAFLGTGIAIGDHPVSIVDNDIQVQVVDGTNAWIWDINAQTWNQVTDSGFYPANTATVLDNYFVHDRKNTNQFFCSALLNGMSYPALQFGAAESSSDHVVAVINYLQQLFVFGQRTTEIFYDAGATPFPFARYQGSVLERGLMSPQAIAKEDGAVFIIGDDHEPYRIQGAAPIAIGHYGVTNWIEHFGGDLATAYAFAIPFNKHKWIVFQFPHAGLEGATWVYDTATRLWHERESLDANFTSLGRWRVSCYLHAWDRHLVGDAFSNKVGIMDQDVFTEWGNPMRGIVTTPPLHRDRMRCRMKNFELDIETGVGTATGQGENPQVMLRWSDDGGRNWTPATPWRGMGRMGQNRHKLKWPKLGSFYERVMEVSITDPVKRAILAAHGEY